MTAIAIEPVKAADLPQTWRARLAQPAAGRATVRIATEHLPAAGQTAEAFATDDPASGIWRNRADMADVPADVRQLRAGRDNRDRSRNARQLLRRLPLQRGSTPPCRAGTCAVIRRPHAGLIG